MVQIVSLTSFPSVVGGDSFFPEILGSNGLLGGKIEGDEDLWQNGAATKINFQGFMCGINASGEISGYNYSATLREEAVSWTNGVETILPSLGGNNDDAYGINDAGILVGDSLTALQGGTGEAVMWQNGQVIGLGFLPGSTGTVAAAINNEDQIIGSAYEPDGSTRAFLWQKGVMTDLGSLNSGDTVRAMSINDNGLIVGFEGPPVPTNSFASPASATPLMWQGGVMSVLPTFSGYTWTYAESVNNAGIIVGETAFQTGDPDSPYFYQAVMWQDGRIIDLNGLLPKGSKWILQEATAINNQNEVIGHGTYDGIAADFILTLGTGAQEVGVSANTALSGTLSTPVQVIDGSADVEASLDGLEGLAKAGNLTSITLLDRGIPNLTVTSAQWTADRAALADIISVHSVTVTFTGNAAQHDFSSDNFAGASALQFADQTVIVAAAPGPASAVTTGNVTELYAAVLDREPDIAGLAFYQNFLKSNPTTPLQIFADYFLNSSEYTSSHSYAPGTAGDTQFIEDSYQNLLHRTPSSAEVNFYLTNVMTKPDAHALMLVYFSASPEFLADVQITAANPASAQHWLILT